jgi:hypothetical protein
MMASELKGTRLGGRDRTVEVAGSIIASSTATALAPTQTVPRNSSAGCGGLRLAITFISRAPALSAKLRNQLGAKITVGQITASRSAR